MRSRVSAAVATGGATRLRRARLHGGLPRGLRDRALLPGAGPVRRGPDALGRARSRWRRRQRSPASATRSSCSARRLPIKPLLITGASILLLLSVAFAGNAVRSLQVDDVIGVTPIEGDWARLPIFLAELTGIHPDRPGDRGPGGAAGRLRRSAPLWVFATAARRCGERRAAEASDERRTERHRRRRRAGRRRCRAADRGRRRRTFTKAVAIEPDPFALRAEAVVPTTHDARRRRHRRGRRRARAARSTRSATATATRSSSSPSRRRRR